MKILIIGQGIAGTLLAWVLGKTGALVHVADGHLSGASSPAAAGIINPVTGKRFVMSWRFEEFFPVAKAMYQEIEQEYRIAIWEERPTLRLLATPEEVNDWSIRCAQPEYAQHLGECENAGDWNGLLKPGFRIGIIRTSARVRFPLLLSTFREKALQANGFLEKNIEYSEVDTLLKTYDRVVFCEGWRATENPFFPGAPFRVSKGEALHIRFKHPPQKEMLKKTAMAVPLENGTTWAGSTYHWNFEDARPTEAARQTLTAYLKEMFSEPFEVTGQVAGIRPTMQDRRPLCAQSNLNPRVFIFNGLGTKGALLGPHFATQMAEKLYQS